MHYYYCLNRKTRMQLNIHLIKIAIQLNVIPKRAKRTIQVRLAGSRLYFAGSVEHYLIF